MAYSVINKYSKLAQSGYKGWWTQESNSNLLEKPHAVQLLSMSPQQSRCRTLTGTWIQNECDEDMGKMDSADEVSSECINKYMTKI